MGALPEILSLQKLEVRLGLTPAVQQEFSYRPAFEILDPRFVVDNYLADSVHQGPDLFAPCPTLADHSCHVAPQRFNGHSKRFVPCREPV